jgi:hypothetical protein
MDASRLRHVLFRAGVGCGLLVWFLVFLGNTVGFLLWGWGWRSVIIGFLWGIPFGLAVFAILAACSWIAGSFE